MEAEAGEARDALGELIRREVPNAYPLDVIVVGGSMSEVQGHLIGTRHSLEWGRAVLRALMAAATPWPLAIQGCEHINRALVVERDVQAEWGWPLVTVYPVPEAGGSLASAAMELFSDPVVVSRVEASAGLDIGQTLIGMHLKPVAVPIRLQRSRVGQAVVTAARCRPPLIGGPRARYEKQNH